MAGRRFSAALAKVRKVDNHAAAMPDKVELRRRLLGEVKGAVFDAFAGSGEMYRRVWHQAPAYVGCDLRWFPDEREAFVADNRRVLRSVDLSRFAVFDLDAYGSPWEQALIVAARRPVKRGERIALALTEGSALRLKMGGIPYHLARLAGLTVKAAGAAGALEEIHERAIGGLADRMGCSVVKLWRARGKTGAAVRYYGLVLEGLAEARAL